MTEKTVAIIGAGPAGLMAAEVLASAGLSVAVYDAMPSPARKFLQAGVGGMNITHAEPFVDFQTRYAEQQAWVSRWLTDFSPIQLREWIHQLGVETVVGTSDRVFPREMKAAPLLRRWLQRLRRQGVAFHMRHRWLGWTATGALLFSTPQGAVQCLPSAVVLALGGGSWPRLGSDGAWVEWLTQQGVTVAPLLPANCGFTVTTPNHLQRSTALGWSAYLAERYAGCPVKNIVAQAMRGDQPMTAAGEFIVTDDGVEGGVVYALSRYLRTAIQEQGSATLVLDLLPDKTVEQIARALARPRGKLSLASHWRKAVGLHGIKAVLLRECTTPAQWVDPMALAKMLKALPLALCHPRPLAEAISTAGGVTADSVDDRLMLHARPGVFCAGEMLDWEAPTGGYLLTACFASGRVAATGVLQWLAEGNAMSASL